MRRTVMQQQKGGVYRRNWRPPQRKRFVGTKTAAAGTRRRFAAFV